MKIADLHTSAASLVKEALEKAKKYADHNIFISFNEEEALKKAAEIDQKIQNGEKVGRLAGVPYALKDNFLSKQGNTTAASKILSNLHSPIDSTTVAKLEAEGAIMIGRTNLDAKILSLVLPTTPRTLNVSPVVPLVVPPLLLLLILCLLPLVPTLVGRFVSQLPLTVFMV